MNKIKIYVSILFILLFSPIYNSFAQVDESDVKSAFILRFCENVRWEKPINKLSIGCFASNDHVFHALKKAENTIKIQNAKIVAKRFSQISDIVNFNAVYINSIAFDSISEINRIARENNILIITDEYPDLLFVMINLNKANDKISYKINVPNLTSAGFEIKFNMLLSGGSVVDIKTAYEKVENQILINQELVKSSEAKLLNLEKLLSDKDNIIKLKERQANEFENQIILAQQKSNEILAQNEIEKKISSQKKKELKEKEIVLKKIFKEIYIKKNELEALRSQIVELRESSENLKSEVNQKNNRLEEQFKFISTQNNLIILFICFIVALIIAAIAITRLFLIKKQLNKTLEDRIEQRTREIQLKSKQYRTLFENTPSAIAEIDFSQVLKLMKAKNLHSKDVFLEYIESDPEIVRECLLLIRYIGANSAHLNLYKISDINDFYNFYASMQDADSLRILGEEIAFLLENESTRSYETVRQNSEGIKMNVLINWVDISEIEYSFSRVILSTTNVTYLRKIESELIMHQNDLESIVRLRTEEIEKLNYTLQNKNGELNELNSHLENEVNKRTIHLRLKNEQLANYAFKNAHNVRGSLARMLGLLYLYEIGTDVSDKEILDKLGIESKAMDLILQQISNELYQNSTEF